MFPYHLQVVGVQRQTILPNCQVGQGVPLTLFDIINQLHYNSRFPF